MARLPLSSSLHAANLVLALFTVGDVYASLCKKKALTLHLARSEGHELRIPAIVNAESRAS